LGKIYTIVLNTIYLDDISEVIERKDNRQARKISERPANAGGIVIWNKG
jgi:hypothetical protein